MPIYLVRPFNRRHEYLKIIIVSIIMQILL